MEANFAARICCCWERDDLLWQFFPGISPVESAQMKSLYDLLGARESDDVDALKKAFRKAVKAHHPDLHPNDPPAVERFTQIIAANALLRDAKRRATYDWLLQREREYFRLTLKRQRPGSKLARQQLRSKRSRTIAVIVAVSALIGGYELWATMPMTGNVEIDNDALAAAAGAAVEKQTATVVAAAGENENPSAAIGAPKADAIKAGKADEPVEPVDGVRMQPANPTDQGEQRHKHDGAAVPNGAVEPSSTPSETNSGATQGIAERELALGPLSNNANAYTARGIASYRSGNFLQAIVSFNAAILLDPDDVQAYDIRGNAWDEMGSFESALADYDEAIRINPNNPAVFHDRAIMWRHKGELDKALIDLDRAIRFTFSDARMYCDRGLVWYESGHHDRAIADFNQAITLDPNSAAACIKRGLVLHRNSEFKLAFASVNQAIRVDPSIVDALRRTNLRP
jgi:curved DNA-binding protein CbpA/Flp pilus assembly protein TadD